MGRPQAVWEMWLHRLDATGQNMSAKRRAPLGKKVISRPNSGFEILGVRNVFPERRKIECARALQA